MQTDSTPSHEHTDLKNLMRQNSELIKENNALLKKIHRNGVIGFWLRVISYLLIIGFPFLLYFLLEPYLMMFGTSYETLMEGFGKLGN